VLRAPSRFSLEPARVTSEFREVDRTEQVLVADHLYRLVGDDSILQRFNCIEFVEELIYGHLRKEPLD
jgi:hypothetical protein